MAGDDRKNAAIFSVAAARRIADAVEAVESEPRDATGKRLATRSVNNAVRWGKIVGPRETCHDPLVVRPTDPDGAYLSDDVDHTVDLFLLNTDDPSCGPFVGVCADTGGLVAYLPTAVGEGIYLNPYKVINVGYVCDDTTDAVPDLQTMGFADLDFKITSHTYSDCSDRKTIADISWRGLNYVDNYLAPSTVVGGIKKLVFDGVAVGSSGHKVGVAFGLVAADDNQTVSGCADPVPSKKLTITPTWKIEDYDTVCDKSGDVTHIGDGTGLTADADSWSHNTEKNLELKVLTRCYWDTAASVLYQYQVTQTFDACGKLLSCSAETQLTVDTTEDCETP